MVTLALQEDVDVIAASSLTTDRLIVPDLIRALADPGLSHVEVIVGGSAPQPEHAILEEAGVADIFGPGARRRDTVDCVQSLAARSRERRQLV